MLAHYPKQYDSRNFVAEEFITGFESVLGQKLERRDFNGNDYSFSGGKARELRLELPSCVIDLIAHEILVSPQLKYEEDEAPVYFVSGDSWDEVKAIKRYRKRAKEYSTKLLSSPHVSDLNRPILEYLHSLDTLIYKPFQKNVFFALEAVRDADDLKPNQKLAIERNLLYFFHQGTIRPIYTVNENRPRVFAMEYSLLTLPKEYRRKVLKGTMEADLKSAHTVIAAYDMDIVELKELFKAGKSFWTELIAQVGVGPDLRGDLKTGVYCLLYGGGIPKIRKSLSGLTREEKARFLKCPIIASLLKARDERLQAIKERKGWLSLGQWLPLNEFKYRAHTLMSIHNQRIETYIIAACYELAKKSKTDFRILSAEHDGFTFQVLRPERETQVKNRLKKAIADKGKTIGIPMELEFTA